MVNLSKISIIGIGVLAAAYGISLTFNHPSVTEPTQESVNTPNAIEAPVSQVSNLAFKSDKSPAPANVSIKARNEASLQKQLEQNQSSQPSRAELADYHRMAPPPPISANQIPDARHQQHEKGHGHEQPYTRVDTEQPAPPAGADI